MLSSRHFQLCVLVFALFQTSAAHDNGMDMSMDGAMQLSSADMVPYLHFTPGDTLWFLGWAPKSGGAVFGACIGLVLLAIVERWLASIRAMAEVFWRQRAQMVLANQMNTRGSKSQLQTASSRLFPNVFSTRAALPFIPAHDITRGIIHAAQTALGFAFMLAVMTFQASFIISIVVGLGIGEMIFGRYISAGAASH